jgi:hypothetical protein
MPERVEARPPYPSFLARGRENAQVEMVGVVRAATRAGEHEFIGVAAGDVRSQPVGKV